MKNKAAIVKTMQIKRQTNSFLALYSVQSFYLRRAIRNFKKHLRFFMKYILSSVHGEIIEHLENKRQKIWFSCHMFAPIRPSSTTPNMDAPDNYQTT